MLDAGQRELGTVLPACGEAWASPHGVPGFDWQPGGRASSPGARGPGVSSEGAAEKDTSKEAAGRSPYTVKLTSGFTPCPDGLSHPFIYELS